MTSRLLLIVAVAAFVPAVIWAWSEAATTVELVKAVFAGGLDIEIGGQP